MKSILQDPGHPKPTAEPKHHLYQFKIYLLAISPQVWRRVLVHPDNNLRDLHSVIQTVFGWEGYHLHQFLLHGTWFGDGPASYGDERRPLSSFHLRARERFQYEYDFTDRWLHEIRLEKLVPVRPQSIAPFCVAGRGTCPADRAGDGLNSNTGEAMRITIRMAVDSEEGEVVADIASIERERVQFNQMGLSLAEGKEPLRNAQKIIVEAQAAEYLRGQARCPDCGAPRRHKDNRSVVFRTLFGNVPLSSPRWFHCACRPHEAKTFSPLSELFPNQVSPELLFMECKWASLMSYGLTTKLLRDVLPIDARLNPSTVRNHVSQVGERFESALGKERVMFIDSSPSQWAEQPHPEGPIFVGFDGAYVRSWNERKTNFEVIVGKSVPTDRQPKCFGFVQAHDTKPKRRLFEYLK